ncbi:restriction endonuclease subunit S [Gluconacetobacter asukensis]|uniref:Restriction endonuclease subunit S n=1 Tax=Gluconacetobacter asukensis TaxID=1017181 RepID=A0A7W4IYB6_9PROT|nr:restriction endonuclease subunit S [Gluconacetobacter asukensis]MBB2170987.1 restriction endonuclease subunit S [Gluconacetobacter asukensis]
MGEWITDTVINLQSRGILRVEDGNHGESRPRPDEFVDVGVAFIRAADMADGVVLFDSASKINNRARERITKGIGKPGDILISHKGTVGRIARAPLNAPDFVCSPQTTFWRSANEEILSQDFLYAYMRSPRFAQEFQVRSGETDMAGYVSLTSQRCLVLSIPPIELQRPIGALMSTLDEKIKLNRRMNKTLEATARAIFKDWFVDFGPTRAKMEGRAPYLAAEIWPLFPSRLDDGGIPEGWTVVPLATLIEINPSEQIARGKSAPYLDMASIPIAGPNPEPYVVREFGSGMRFRNGDALLARITPCLENGKTAFVQNLPEGEVGWGSTEFIVLRSRPPLPKALTYLIARDPVFRANAIRSMTGTSGRQRASNDAISAYFLTQPKNDTLWTHLNNLIAPMFDRIAANDRENQSLAATRDLLLPKLMSGEVRVKDAEKIVRPAT